MQYPEIPLARMQGCAISTLLVIVLLTLPARAQKPQSHSDCEHSAEAQEFEREIQAQRAELVRINGDGTNQKLKSELLNMGKVDQDIRRRMFSLPNDQQSALIPELQKTDESLTSRLKQIVSSYGWPTIALVGIQASQAAALILVHSPDHDFQRRLIPELQKLVEQKKIAGSDIATLIDKTLVAEGKPQRFGTQFSWKNNGPMVMNPVEDPEHLDQRRKIYLLPPMDLYKCEMQAMYHRKIE